MRLRIRHKDGIATLTTLDAQSTLLDLHNAIANEIKTPVEQLELKMGYPPKLLSIDNDTAYFSLDLLGIRDGEQILTAERPNGSAPTFNFTSNRTLHTSPSSSSSASGPVLDTQSSAHGHTLTSTTTLGTAGGFGSNPVVVEPSAFQARVPASNAFGGLSTADVTYNPPIGSTMSAPAESPSTVDGVRIRDQGVLVIREVEDDNSCLFNAIAYTLDPSKKNNVQELREIVAHAIEANPDAYPDVVLGRPRKEYCEWIKKENSWGGAIELAIFSEHYKIEIDSIDVLTNRVDRFGEGQYSQRALVMYSGIHYDAVALTPGLDIPAECDQTQFDITSEDIMNAGVQLAAKLKKVSCSICQLGLKGEKDAQQHAKQTMHTSFEEYQ
ncbi:ubiquitin-specific protease otu1 [Mortierella polycephala]|uniref:Ubiquitin thioesterase OTU n=1 Tax=Mortierella polycephala TaxID=41804 RepID=A0A9P6TWD1_9FUNG|nr:ubiquitin-specific protease otu1 [Mortierella polycephala]